MRLMLDCDGVLANFDAAAEEILGMPSRQYEEIHGSKALWATISAIPDFYTNLKLMPDAMDLYNAVKHLNPKILTGCPQGGWAEKQKQRWKSFWFPEIEMITCKSAEKSKYCEKGDILIDDWPKYANLWENAGGVFIHHISAGLSILKLKSLHPELFDNLSGEFR